ncbi:hypothetical protein HKCCE3408_18370 [Rhodobacterales bacterium HKCCE3408]|nr:hypothetical protein [Rhodobacterales bacterium HKCCE3408]
MVAVPFETFLSIADAIAGEFGNDFLLRLTEALSTHLDASFVSITIGEGDPATHARALCALQGRADAGPVHYALNGTPCERVYQGETLVVPCDLADRYPDEAPDAGYIGLPIHGDTGQVIGHIAIFTRDEIREPDVVMATLRIFAQRAELEVRRMSHEAEREALIGDLTDMAGRLQRGYAQLREENAAKSRLLGLIAHDLRSPLAAVMSQAELGLTRATRHDTARAATSFEKILAGTDRMSGLIAATLERARAEGEAMAIRPVAADVHRLARLAVEANRPDAGRKEIALRLDRPRGDASAEIDDTLIVSAIDNLVSNAIKYTHPGGEVRVGVTPGDDLVSITVADTGQGLNADDLDRAFGRFQVLSARPTGGESSTGLGLANVRDIAQAHGGRVEAESDGPGRGSLFRLILPRRPVA